MKKNLICFLVLLTVGCGKVGEKKVEFITYRLESKSYAQEIIASIPRLKMLDTLLIVGSVSQKDPFCMALDINDSMKIVGEFGRLGRGPGEFISPIITGIRGDCITVSNANVRNFTLMKIENNKGKIESKTFKRYDYPSVKDSNGNYPLLFRDNVPLNDDYYVGSIFGADINFLSLFDSNMNLVSCFGEFPVEGDFLALKGKVDACDNGMIFAPTDLPYVAYYELRDGGMEKVWDDYYVDTTDTQNELIAFMQTSVGLLTDICLSDKYAYLLYLDVPTRENDYRIEEKSIPYIVYVYDRSGVRKGRLELDKRICRLTVDEKHGKIYGLASFPDYHIVEFDLPKFH